MNEIEKMTRCRSGTSDSRIATATGWGRPRILDATKGTLRYANNQRANDHADGLVASTENEAMIRTRADDLRVEKIPGIAYLSESACDAA